MPAQNQANVTSIFREGSKAQGIVDWLVQRGYDSREISVVMSEETRSLHFAESEHDRLPPGTRVIEGMGIGGAIGTAAGASLAAIAAIGTFLPIPGLGLVAGPLAAAFAGGGAGALAGGVIGALLGMGISEAAAESYKKALRGGGVLVGVKPRSEDERVRISQHFAEQGGENMGGC